MAYSRVNLCQLHACILSPRRSRPVRIFVCVNACVHVYACACDCVLRAAKHSCTCACLATVPTRRHRRQDSVFPQPWRQDEPLQVSLCMTDVISEQPAHCNFLLLLIAIVFACEAADQCQMHASNASSQPPSERTRVARRARHMVMKCHAYAHVCVKASAQTTLAHMKFKMCAYLRGRPHGLCTCNCV